MFTYFRKIKLIVFSIFYIPHFLLWRVSSHKNEIDADVKTIENKNIIPYKGFFLKAFLLQSDPYFRKLFYYRIGPLSAICRWYTPGERTFIIACKSLGRGGYFPHSYATIIYAKSIGDNFSCRQCTTIGNKSDERDDERPVIGNNVEIGANVCIIGGISIGNNVVVGAGSIVTKDIPDNCIVVGNPAKIVRRIND